jgi:metal-dependent hydrolase (beta-lactamase superfamily II)
VLSLPGAMLGHNADPAVRAAWLEDMFLPPDVLEWALNVVVVRNGGRTILIDAGMGVEFPDLPRAGRLVQRLEAAGIDLASVTDVVLTHLHMDHVGGLLVDGVRDRLSENSFCPSSSLILRQNLPLSQHLSSLVHLKFSEPMGGKFSASSFSQFS